MTSTDTCTAQRHGTLAAYRHARCRCPDAREAKRLYDKRRPHGLNTPGRINAVGTSRRIHALMRLGHTAETIAAAAGRTASHVATTARARTWVTPPTAAAYRHAYNTLSMTPGTSAPTRARAAAWGWAPPLAWDEDTIDNPDAQPWQPNPRPDRGPDHAAVERAVAGDPAVLRTRIDRREAVAALVAAGVSDETIAERLRMDVRAVAKARQRITRPTLAGAA